ncbi:MAG TPA: DUF6471 domain-containing protein [Candidatus Glassbacteria bacterium]|jgi:hypothetical protein|nr:DUF6471 domain-containing protein [Candidatus Glassbacteria bacterium]
MARETIDWPRVAKNRVRSDMIKYDIDYATLLIELKKMGINKNIANLRKTIWLGRFSHCFYLQVQEVIKKFAVDKFV